MKEQNSTTKASGNDENSVLCAGLNFASQEIPKK
jgi:hypothetical protein